VEILLQVAAALLVGAISGAVASWLTLRVRFERFVSMDEERNLARNEWRQSTEKRLNSHAKDIKNMSNHEFRMSKLEAENERYRNEWHKFSNDKMKSIEEIYDEKIERITDKLERWKDEMIRK
jgi:DNA-directed RNA polymerase alpha subunit